MRVENEAKRPIGEGESTWTEPAVSEDSVYSGDLTKSEDFWDAEGKAPEAPGDAWTAENAADGTVLDAAPEEQPAYAGADGAKTTVITEQPAPVRPIKDLNGLHGWLKFFYAMGVIEVVFSGIGFALSFAYGMQGALLAGIAYLPTIVLLIIMLCQMGKRNIAFRKTYIILVVLNCVTFILGVIVKADMNISDVPIGSFLWLFYLYNSERVKITFGLKPDPLRPEGGGTATNSL